MVYIYIYIYIHVSEKCVFIISLYNESDKSNKWLHLFYDIYITYIYTCTEEATETVAKYLQNKICF